MMTIADKLDRETLSEKLDPDCSPQTLRALICFAVGEILCVLIKLTIRVSSTNSISNADLNRMLFADTLKYLLVRALCVYDSLCLSLSLSYTPISDPGAGTSSY